MQKQAAAALRFSAEPDMIDPQMSAVQLITGPALAGKTARLLEEYRAALADAAQAGEPGTTLWLTPTHHSRRQVLSQLIDERLGGCFAPNVFTFEKFAEKILEFSSQPVAPLRPVARRRLVRTIIDRLYRRGGLPPENPESGFLSAEPDASAAVSSGSGHSTLDSGLGIRPSYFASIADTAGFLDLLLAFLSELKRDEIWPEHFTDACRTRGESPKDHELGLIYAEYQRRLHELRLFDAEGRFWSARDCLDRGEWGPFGRLSLVVVDGFTDFSRTQYEILRHLAERSGKMLVSLPLESPLERDELFAKTLAVRDRLVSGELTVDSCQLSVVSPRTPSLSPDNCQLTTDDGRRTTTVNPRGHWSSVISQYLFANPRGVRPQAEADGLEILAATGQKGEAEAVAGRVKRLLLAGVPAEEIVVAARPLDEYAGLLSRTFTASGIPFAGEAGIPLGRAPLVKALSAVFRLELEDWPFQRLRGVLDSNYFRPEWDVVQNRGGVRQFLNFLRRFELHGEREAIARSLERATSKTEEAAGAETARALFQKLDKATAPLRREHDFGGWCRVTLALARELGIAPPVEGVGSSIFQFSREGSEGLHHATDKIEILRTRPHSLDSGLDRRTWQRLEELLGQARAAEELLGDDAPAPAPLPEFVQRFAELLRDERLQDESPPAGRVRILAAEDVRNLDVPHLFLVGLTESAFPRIRRDDCLYGEAEREELAGHGLSLARRSTRQQEEMLLFYGIVTRARRSLTISYPAVSSGGQPLFASPYLAAIRDLFEPEATRPVEVGGLDPVPSREAVLTDADLRLAATDELHQARPGLFRAFFKDSMSRVEEAKSRRVKEDVPTQPSSDSVTLRLFDSGTLRLSTARNILAAVDAAVARFRTRGFTGYEGVLNVPAHRRLMQERFSSDHHFSATSLESYAGCGFRFFMESVLGIEPLEEPGVATDYLRRGSIVHRILAELHRGYQDDAGEIPAGEELAKRFRELLPEEVRRYASDTRLGRALAGVEEQLLAEWAEQYAQHWNEYRASFGEAWEEPPRPALLEVPFGKVPSDEGEESSEESIPDAVSIGDAEMTPGLCFGAGGQAVRVAGRIDRVDVGRSGGRPVFNVIDYKSGAPPRFNEEDVTSGRAIQLALYALAVRRLGLVDEEAVPFQIGYWSLRETGFVRGLKDGRRGNPPLEAAVVAALDRMLEELIPRLAAGIRAGHFAVSSEDENCTRYCPYNTVCRITQLRPLKEKLEKRMTSDQ